MQEALHEGEDLRAPRRAELLAQIRDAQERRDEARRDYSNRVIDRAFPRLQVVSLSECGTHAQVAGVDLPCWR